MGIRICGRAIPYRWSIISIIPSGSSIPWFIWCPTFGLVKGLLEVTL